ECARQRNCNRAVAAPPALASDTGLHKRRPIMDRHASYYVMQFLTLLAVLLLVLRLQGQRPGSIQGQVRGTAREGIAGASIRIAPGRRRCSTDADGHFRIGQVAPGRRSKVLVTLRLLGAEGRNGVDTGGAAGWKVAGQRRQAQ